MKRHSRQYLRAFFPLSTVDSKPPKLLTYRLRLTILRIRDFPLSVSSETTFEIDSQLAHLEVINRIDLVIQQ